MRKDYIAEAAAATTHIGSDRYGALFRSIYEWSRDRKILTRSSRELFGISQMSSAVDEVDDF